MDVLTTKCVNQTQLDRLRSLLPSDDQLWLDGRLTAGEHASKVKQNKQLDPSSTESGLAVDMVTKILCDNLLIKSFTLVKKVHSVMFARSDMGDGYGWHVDNPFSKNGRRDLSFTLFLAEPLSYDGGDLSIQIVQDILNYKLPAGEVVVYPSSALHCVQPVSSGSRLVCVGWIESYVRSHEDRLMLFNLDAGARGLLAKHGRSDELDLIFQAYANAVRRLAG